SGRAPCGRRQRLQFEPSISSKSYRNFAYPISITSSKGLRLLSHLSAVKCKGNVRSQRDQHMTAVYASTTRTWFDALAPLRPERVAFWQPTPARPSRIQPGERWYFKELGAPHVLGFGEYAEWEKLTIGDLFEKYGIATGYRTKSELTAALQIF